MLTTLSAGVTYVLRIVYHFIRKKIINVLYVVQMVTIIAVKLITIRI